MKKGKNQKTFFIIKDKYINKISKQKYIIYNSEIDELKQNISNEKFFVTI